MKKLFFDSGISANRFNSADFENLLKNNETPFYLYSGETVADRFSYLKSRMRWKNTEIFYAMKSNFNPHILKLLCGLGSGIDAVSPAEVFLALKCGFAPEKIIFTSNNNTDDEIDQVAALGVLLNIDSLSRLEKYGKKYSGSAVCLRFNTDIVAGEHEHIQTGGLKTKFGIQMEETDYALEIAARYGLKIAGIHKHTGSGISDKSKYLASMKNLLSVAVPEKFPDLEFIDFGGGFKARYHPDEKETDYDAFGAEAGGLFEDFCRSYGKDLRLIIEPGKFLTAEAGILVVQVNTLKKNRSRTIAGVNSGFTHLIRPVLYNAYHHIVNLSNPDGEEKIYDICGDICESGDCFATDRSMSEIREGDYLALMNAGAYCRSMASVYNLRPVPSEIYSFGNDFFKGKSTTASELAELIYNESFL